MSFRIHHPGHHGSAAHAVPGDATRHVADLEDRGIVTELEQFEAAQRR